MLNGGTAEPTADGAKLDAKLTAGELQDGAHRYEMHVGEAGEEMVLRLL